MVVTKGTRKQGRGVDRMSHRTAAWLAWSLCAVCVAFTGLAFLLDFLTDTSVIHAGYFQSAYDERGLLPGDAHPSLTVITGVLSLAYPIVGALIASRLPTNPIGWIFCGVGLLYNRAAFHHSVHRLCVARESRISRWGGYGLVLNVGSVLRNNPGRSLPDAAVSRRLSTISSLANRGVDGCLGSCVVQGL